MRSRLRLIRTRVAIADDSSFMRKALAQMLSAEPRIQVVGAASTGEELLANLEVWQPHVIMLDLSMPGMGGLATLERIMQQRPTPVIVLSTHSRKNAPLTIEALHRGALDFVDKQQYSLVDFQTLGGALVEKILEVSRQLESEAAVLEPSVQPEPPVPEPNAAEEPTRYEILVMGASTGGPPAIQRILEDLGPGVGVPIAIVQHMPEGFTRAFAQRLDTRLPLLVREAAHGEVLRPGSVYIAPAGLHLRVRRDGDQLHALLSAEPADMSHRPSVDILFSSAGSAVGPGAVAVLLTGMGQDGAREMARLARAGSLTIAQDEATSAVYGMPRAAVELTGAREILSLGAIGPRLEELLTGR
jgi:two-component system chemotaxis response regulator CheB